MSVIQVQVTSLLPVAPGCCPYVMLCLGEGAPETTSGVPVIKGKLNGPGRWLNGSKDYDNHRCSPVYQYSVEIIAGQLVLVEDEEPPVLCEHVVELAPYSCIFEALIAAIVDLQAP